MRFLVQLNLVGLCGAAEFFLGSKYVENLNADDMRDLVRQYLSNSDSEPLIVYQYADWCPHCQSGAPAFERLARSDKAAKFAAVNCAGAGAEFCAGECAVSAYPTIRRFHKGVNQVLPTSEVLSETGRLASVAAHLPQASSGSLASRWTAELDADQAAKVRRSDGQAAVAFLLRTVAPSSAEYPVIGKQRLAAIRKFLVLISSTFPSFQVRQDARTLLSGLKDERISLTVSEWMERLNKLKSFTEEKQKFKHCGQYSCGLWQLFHLLSLAADRKYLVDSASTAGASEVMEFIRFVVENFFQCEECVKEFVAMFDQRDLDRPARDKVALWLWKVHNAVTARLVKRDSLPLNPVWPPFETPSADEALFALTTNYWSDEWLTEPDYTAA